MNNFDQEIPKYRKNTGSNISKVKKKSKHKHQYKECIIRYKFSFMGKDNLTTQLLSYCSICGKIGDRLKGSIVKDYIKSELYNRRTIYSIMTGTELYEQYHEKLPVFFVEDIYKERYVDLKQNNNLKRE